MLEYQCTTPLSRWPYLRTHARAGGREGAHRGAAERAGEGMVEAAILQFFILEKNPRNHRDPDTGD